MDGYTHVYSFSRPFDYVKNLLRVGVLIAIYYLAILRRKN